MVCGTREEARWYVAQEKKLGGMSCGMREGARCDVA